MKKCIRIEYEYDDGTIRRIQGDPADIVHRAINGAFTVAAVHGMGGVNVQLPWEEFQTTNTLPAEPPFTAVCPACKLRVKHWYSHTKSVQDNDGTWSVVAEPEAPADWVKAYYVIPATDGYSYLQPAVYLCSIACLKFYHSAESRVEILTRLYRRPESG